MSKERQGARSSGTTTAVAQSRRLRKRFLESLYGEIVASLDADLAGQNQYAMLGMMQTARTAHAFDAMPPIQTQSRFADALVQFQIIATTAPATQAAVADLRLEMGAENDRTRRRLAAFARNHGLLVLCICAHSQTFRNHLDGAPNQAAAASGVFTWEEASEQIGRNAASLELFGRMHHVDWVGIQIYHDDMFRALVCDVFAGLLNLTDPTRWQEVKYFGEWAAWFESRHNIPSGESTTSQWALRGPKDAAQRLMMRYEQKVLISDPSAKRRKWDRIEIVVPQQNLAQSRILVAPDYPWPRDVEWPQPDPRYCTSNSDPCRVCTAVSPLVYNIPVCQCTRSQLPGNCEWPLLELFQTATVGTGVRALQTIQSQRYIAEYTGELYPNEKRAGSRIGAKEAKYNSIEGGMYRHQLDIASRTTKMVGRGRTRVEVAGPLATNEYKNYVVDPAVFGNWTRYLNHSCASNLTFEHINVGQKLLCVVSTLRRINFGEQMTVNYGDGYFQEKRMNCRCLEDRCRLWDAENYVKPAEGAPNPVAITLGQMRRAGTAPAWATTGATGQPVASPQATGSGAAATTAAKCQRVPQQMQAPGKERRVQPLRGEGTRERGQRSYDV